MLKTIIFIILLTFILTVFSGMGILTKAIIDLDRCVCTIEESNKDSIDTINRIASLTDAEKQEQIRNIPKKTKPEPNDDRKISLTDSELTVARIGIITFWIVSSISILFVIFKKFF